jgi:hypothetical protein
LGEPRRRATSVSQLAAHSRRLSPFSPAEEDESTQSSDSDNEEAQRFGPGRHIEWEAQVGIGAYVALGGCMWATKGCGTLGAGWHSACGSVIFFTGPSGLSGLALGCNVVQVLCYDVW